MLWQVRAPAPDVVASLRRIEFRTYALVLAARAQLTQGGRLMGKIQELLAAEEANKAEITRAITILEDISARLAAALENGDPSAIQGVIDDLNAETTALKAADDAAAPPTP